MHGGGNDTLRHKRQDGRNHRPVLSGITGTMTANEAQIEGTGEKVNLFDYHVKADTILFQYTTPDGRDEVVKFPLTGFCGNYLQLLI